MTKYNLATRLIHNIVFLRNLARNDLEEDNWVEEFDSFAQIIPIYSNKFSYLEGMDFGDVISEKYFVFKMRYLNNITHNMRIKFNNRIFEIKRIVNVAEGNKFLDIVALEIS